VRLHGSVGLAWLDFYEMIYDFNDNNLSGIPIAAEGWTPAM